MFLANSKMVNTYFSYSLSNRPRNRNRFGEKRIWNPIEMYAGRTSHPNSHGAGLRESEFGATSRLVSRRLACCQLPTGKQVCLMSWWFGSKRASTVINHASLKAHSLFPFTFESSIFFEVLRNLRADYYGRILERWMAYVLLYFYVQKLQASSNWEAITHFERDYLQRSKIGMD